MVMRRYLFTEMFAAMGLAAYSSIAQDVTALEQARRLYSLIDELDGKLSPKVEPTSRRFRGHSHTMMMINLCQVLREADPERSAHYTQRIDRQIVELFRFFVKPELKALLETVGPDGELSEGSEGRCVNPGHAIETAWFLLSEATYRSNGAPTNAPDNDLLKKGLQLLDWHLERGWDDEFGGLFSFLDVDGRQPAQVEWDMKYWWPHCEALYAVLLAYRLTGNAAYEHWFYTIHNYTWAHFPDRKYGEWFGYLRRDGSVKMDLKGNHYKGPFHIPRCLMFSYELLKEM